jgi:hypothetical protein
MRAPIAIAGIVLATAGAPAREARANGAFPESLQILLPAAHPHQLALTTNFGLIISDDDGATWTWTCEQPQTSSASGYGVGAPPLDRFFALVPSQSLAYSDDGSCSWHEAGGIAGRFLATDFFPDPVDANRVFVVGASSVDGSDGTGQVFASADGGATFGAPLFTAPAGAGISGVESSRSAPLTIYVAVFTTPGLHPKVARSMDAGQTWMTFDVEASLGANEFRIIAVDPIDPMTLTVRVFEPLADSLAISRDGGVTFAKAALPVAAALAGRGATDGGASVPPLALTSYVRLDSGTILVGGVVSTYAVGFRSTDGGANFVNWPGVPHLRGLAARGNRLYAAAKNYSDGWAVGLSTDEGLTFTPLTTYDGVSSVRDCAQATCGASCLSQVARQIWRRDVCEAGGVDPSDGDGPAPVEPSTKKTGCGCLVGGDAGRVSGAGLLGGLLLVAALLAARRPRRR